MIIMRTYHVFNVRHKETIDVNMEDLRPRSKDQDEVDYWTLFKNQTNVFSGGNYGHFVRKSKLRLYHKR